MQNRCFVLKCGGSTLAELPEAFFNELKGLMEEGWIPVIVHGGGPAITQLLDQMGIKSEFVEGLRVTDETVLNVVEMVLAGSINKRVVRRVQQTGAKAIGLSGIDGLLLEAKRVADHRVGYVGEVIHVNVDVIHGLVNMGYIPVIAPVGIDQAGQRYNINADTAAGAVASHLGVEQMVVVTDVPGIRKVVNGETAVVPSLTMIEIEEMIASGEIYGGMIPKVRAAMQCMQGDVKQVVIVSGTEPDVLSRVVRGMDGGTRIEKQSSCV